jgi:TonB family protein
MASESLTPPPSSSGGPAKYVVILLLLLGGGLGVYLATSGGDPKRPPPEIKSPERSTALTNDTVEIPVEEEPDAAPPPVEEPTAKKPRTGGGGDLWSCEGELPPADIRKVLGDQQASIRSCYERALRNDNQLQGSVQLEVRIGNDGKVSNTRIHGSLRDPEVSKCVQNLARNWVFHSPSGGSCAVFKAPYNFTPKH